MNDLHGADRQAIDEIQRRFALAVDAKKFTEIARLFTEDGLIYFNREISVREFIAIFSETQQIVDTQHFSVNSVAVIDGRCAVSSSYFFAYHRVPAKCANEKVNQIYGRYDVETDLFLGGAYDDELVRTADGWRFAVRKIGILWRQTLPASARMQPRWTVPVIFASDC
jgi:SnoaL-like domain